MRLTSKLHGRISWAAVFLASALVATALPSATVAYVEPDQNHVGDLPVPLRFPVNGYIVGKVNPVHDGYDLRAWGDIGAPVFSSFTGWVIAIDPDTNPPGTPCGSSTDYGKVVKIDHGGGFETRYAHLDSFAVVQGMHVTTGQLIGFEGITGHTSCTPHVHFELIDNNWANPAVKWVDINAIVSGLTVDFQNNIFSEFSAGSPIGFDGHWWLRSTPNAGTAKIVHYGLTGDIPVMGDWNGDAYDTPGVIRFNKVSGHYDWFLYNTPNLNGIANNTNLGAAQQTVSTYGDPGDSLHVGNWDGVGGDNIGVSRPNAGFMYWYLNGISPQGFLYGLQSDSPVVGNWDCLNGSDSVGVARYQPNGLLQWLLNNGTDSQPDYTFQYGVTLPSRIDRVQSSQWSNTNSFCSKPLVVRGGAHTWYFAAALGSTVGSTLSSPVTVNYFPIAADWDSDSTDDAVAAH